MGKIKPNETKRNQTKQHQVPIDPMESINPNKHLKEQFVSNLTGSSMLEIFFLITSFPLLILIRHCLQFYFPISAVCTKKTDDDDGDVVVVRNKSFRDFVAVFIVDYSCIVVPYILFMTWISTIFYGVFSLLATDWISRVEVLSEWSYGNTTLTLLLLLFLISFKRNGDSSLREDGIDSTRENISSYRVSMMLLTCICILAVDFKIFPRRFAKTETYGTGMMDLGVGGFVAANSLVSRQARGIYNMTLRNALYSTSPLIILGFARLISTSSVNYQVHVGEYGVHWNFFFTLASVAILTSIVNIPPNYCGTLGAFILIGYQALLSCGLNKYLVSEERGTDIISLNKEGIFSIFGYWGMYLVGVQMGSYLFFGDKASSTSRTRKWAKNRVCALCISFWTITLLLDFLIERVSRRMCNLAYVSLVWAINLQVLAILMLADFVSASKISALEEAINRNLLAFFLLANLLTGVVNLSVDTLSVSSSTAIGILFVYTFLLCSAVGYADICGIRLKFW